MPKGKPNKKFRKINPLNPPGRKPKMHEGDLIRHDVISKVETNETDAQIMKRIAERFKIFSELANDVVKGKHRSLIISGPAGIGKTYTVEEAIQQIPEKRREKRICVLKGYVRAPSLFETLYRYRGKGCTIVFDDSDSVLFDPVVLNMLKAVTDSCPVRKVSYLSKFGLFADNGMQLPETFEFHGSIIFISNIDFDTMIAKSHKLGPHLSALVSRSHYLTLAMTTKRDYLVRIKQVAGGKKGLLSQTGLTPAQQKVVLKYIEENADRMRELSLRMVLKVAGLYKTHKNWKYLAEFTCLKNS